jgi:hypothetical protein
MCENNHGVRADNGKSLVLELVELELTLVGSGDLKGRSVSIPSPMESSMIPAS